MFDLAAVRALLAGTRFANVRHVEETRSTNEDILPLLTRDDPAPHSLVTDHQTIGQGRREGRQWHDTKGTSLLWTTALPPLVTTSLWAVPFWAALRIAEGISDAAQVEVQLQWPNDILLDGRKVAGVLCVSRIVGETAMIGCGIGMNVFRPQQPLPVEKPAAFIADYAATTREQLLACVLHRFDEAWGDLRAPFSVARAWEMRARLKGTPYRILRDGSNEAFTATAQRISDDGSLVVLRNGVEETVALGEVQVLR